MSIVLLGSTSGSCTLQEQAVAGTTTLTLPTFNGTVGLLVSGTAVASTSGTSIDFTGIPAGVRRITVMFNGVSTNGTALIQVQLGDSGGIETSGYVATGTTLTNGGTCQAASSTTGFPIEGAVSASSVTRSNSVIITSMGSNLWNYSSAGGSSHPAGLVGGGAKTLSATLDRIRITTVGGTDTFDAGSINILYE